MGRISGAELTERFRDDSVCLISCLSFETRSLSVARVLAGSSLDKWLCLRNADIETDIHELIAAADSLAANNAVTASTFETYKRDPLSLADGLIAILNRAASWSKRVLIDISTMTHEMVLVLVAALSELRLSESEFTIVYNAARQYSLAEADQSRKWISRGIHGVRSVVGFPGLWSPGDPTCLIALPGFDLERVRRIFEELEPDRLVVGIGLPALHQHDWLSQRNREVAEQLLSVAEGFTFEYPALDLVGVAESCLYAAAGITGNVVLAPLNSKPSTFAVGLVAMLKPEWQVCYAPALVYNISYSEPSDDFFVWSITDVWQKVLSLDPGGARLAGAVGGQSSL